MKIYMQYRPCNCGLLDGQAHYHVNEHDVIPWDQFYRSVEKYENQKLADKIKQAIEEHVPEGAEVWVADHQFGKSIERDAQGKPVMVTESLKVLIGDAPDDLLQESIKFNEQEFMREVSLDFGRQYVAGKSADLAGQEAGPERLSGLPGRGGESGSSGSGSPPTGDGGTGPA